MFIFSSFPIFFSGSIITYIFLLIFAFSLLFKLMGVIR